MRYQVLLIPNIKDEIDKVIEASGLLAGLLINCETDEKLLSALEIAAKYDHYAEVRVLKDDEELLTRDEMLGVTDVPLQETE